MVPFLADTGGYPIDQLRTGQCCHYYIGWVGRGVYCCGMEYPMLHAILFTEDHSNQDP